MDIPWDIWLGIAFVAVSAVLLLAEGVISLRTSNRGTWKAIGFCSLAMAFCVSGTVGMHSLYSLNGRTLESIKNPPGPSYLRPEWGADMSKQDRKKHSEMLAGVSFQNWGITVDYFDETGNLRPYQPTDADRAKLQRHRKAIVQFERTNVLLELVMFAWLFVPWLGLVAGFMPWSVRVLNALTRRSKSDALQSSSAPLS